MEPSVASQALGFVAFAALVLALLGLCAWLRHHNARSAVATPQASAERCINGQWCTVIGCDEPVQVNIHAGHDYYPMCIGHGLPYLREDVDAEDVLDAAAEDFRGEFAQIEAWANGETR